MDKISHLRPSEEIAPEQLAQAGAAVADLAHLAKNILQILSGCSEIIDLALNTEQFDRVRQAWQLHQPGFWRLKKFQLDLIKFTKQYPVNPESCDVNDVIVAAGRQLDPFFVKRSIDFSVRSADPSPCLIADAEKLRDAVVNLLVTAADNLQDQPGQIALETSLTASGDAVRITVIDSGPRLDAVMCQALLTPCERCRNMLGTGLEIPLTLRIAEAHRGSLHINPNDNGPNTLVLSIPTSGLAEAPFPDSEQTA